MWIFLNGTEKEVENQRYTLEEIVKLKYLNSGCWKNFTISITDKENRPVQIRYGELVLEEGMKINVDLTIGS